MAESKVKQRVKRKSQITVTETATAEYARTGTVRIGTKTINIPCYVPKIRKKLEMDIVADEKKLSPRFQGLAFDIMDVDAILREIGYNGERRPKRRVRFTLDYGVLRELLPILIDPCTEYFYFRSAPKRAKFAGLEGIPAFVKEVLRNASWENHTSTWHEIMDKNNIDTLIGWNARYQSKYRADIIIPPVPLIADENSSLLETSFDVNRKSAFAVADAYDKEPAVYFLLNYIALRDMKQLKKIVEFVYDMDDEFREVKAVFLKIRNFDVRDDQVRKNIGDFTRSLSSASRFNNCTTLMLDADSLGLLSVCNGLDGLCEPLDGNLRDFGSKKGVKIKRTHMGRYYHPKRLKFLGFAETKKIYRKADNTLPCNCVRCSFVNTQKLEGITPDAKTWNNLRREHLFWSRNSEIEEVANAIADRGDTHPVWDKVTRSAVKDYLDILPNPIN